MSDVYSTSENYDYLYEKLEEFYNVSVTAIKIA